MGDAVDGDQSFRIWHFPIRSNVTEAEEEDREYHANPTEAACASTTLIRKTEVIATKHLLCALMKHSVGGKMALPQVSPEENEPMTLSQSHVPSRACCLAALTRQQ
eukprot:764874-Hanusia_phi.AAC.2